MDYRMRTIFFLAGFFAVMTGTFFGFAGRWDLPLAWAWVSVYAPFIVLGSWWALVPAAGVVGVLLRRTILEDRFLRRELAGYQDYARTVRYRLLPGIW